MNPFDTPTNNFQHFNNLEKKTLPSHPINQTHQTINQITNSNRPSQLTNLDSHLSKDFSSHNFLPFWNWNLHENVTSAIIVNLHRKYKRKYVCVLKFVFYSHYFLFLRAKRPLQDYFVRNVCCWCELAQHLSPLFWPLVSFKLKTSFIHKCYCVVLNFELAAYINLPNYE